MKEIFIAIQEWNDGFRKPLSEIINELPEMVPLAQLADSYILVQSQKSTDSGPTCSHEKNQI